jgi:hypothetical protein
VYDRDYNVGVPLDELEGDWARLEPLIFEMMDFVCSCDLILLAFFFLFSILL